MSRARPNDVRAARPVQGQVAQAVYFVDMEARTPVGLSAAAAAAAVRANISRVAEHPFMKDPAGEPLRCAADQLLDPSIVDHRRLAAIAGDPLERLCARLPDAARLRLQVILTTPELRPGWDAESEAAVRRTFQDVVGRHRSLAQLVWSERGHAGGLQALQLAAAAIAREDADICVVGGVDSYLHPDTLDWLFAQRRVAGAGRRSGFFPGEAAGFVLLAGAAVRRQWRLSPMACLRGVGAANEPIRWDADDECMGVGLAEAVREAAAGLPRDTQIDRIICDINGERYRAQEWGMAVMKTQPLFRDPTGYESAAAAWGDVGAATGALSAILAVRGWVRGYAQHPHTLLFAGSDGGLRAAALLERADARAPA